MFLVEYTQSKGKKKFDYCSGFYNDQEAFDFAIKLEQCSNIDSVLVSKIDTSFAEVLYRNDEVFENGKM